MFYPVFHTEFSTLLNLLKGEENLQMYLTEYGNKIMVHCEYFKSTI